VCLLHMYLSVSCMCVGMGGGVYDVRVCVCARA